MDCLLRSIEFVESSLPVLYFDLDESKGSIAAMNGDLEHQTECYGEMRLQIPKGYTCEYGDEPKIYDKNFDKSYDLDYIRGRGNSTWIFAILGLIGKKPYKVKLDKKVDLLGMGKNKHWVLLANAFDNSLLRNKMTYRLGEQMGMPYTPQLVPVDVVLNGEYYGSYYLSEQVRIGENRINIDDLDDNPDVTTEPEITGGYLLSMGAKGMDEEEKIDNKEDKEHEFTTKRDHSFLIESPSFEEKVNPAQYNYIKNYMQQTENAIYGKGFKDKHGKSYAEYMDLDAAVDYFWIQEFSKNGDAYISDSTYLYKPRYNKDNPGSDKLYWGPLWDFDFVAWGNLEYDEKEVEGFDTYEGTWFNQMLRDPVFAKKVEDRWQDLKPMLQEITRKGGWLDEQEQALSISQRYDHEAWGFFSFDELFGEEEAANANKANRSYHDEIEQLRGWIKSRSNWVNKNVTRMAPKPKKIKLNVNGKTWKTLTILSGDPIGKLPTPKAKKGYVFAGWYYYGVRIGKYETVEENMTLKAKFVSNKKNPPAENLFVRAKHEYVSIGDEKLHIDYCIRPYSPVKKTVTWTSSRKSVATVNSGGIITLKKEGTTTITGKLKNGVKTSFKLHVLDEDSSYEGDISANKNKLAIAKGNYKKITFNAVDSDGIEWISLDEGIATVNDVGLVTGKKRGMTYVICMDYDGVIIAKCKVIVGDSVKNTYLKSVKGRKHYVKVKWKTRPGKVTGYQVRISQDKHFAKHTTWKTVKGSRKGSVKLKGLSRGKTYYVSVRSYKKVNGNVFHSKWSKTKTARTR